MKKRIKILSIDDSEDILFAISAICDYKDWEALTSNNAEKGISLFKTSKPDLVLVDYHMPDMDGIQIVRELRKINKFIPIIVLTVEERQEVADEFIKNGANDFALKPIKAVDLISRIMVHIKRNKQYEETKKGISGDTLDIICSYLENREEYSSIDIISEKTGLAYKTVHRYLQYMIEEGLLDVKYDYGRQGRPKNSYKLNR